MKALGLVVSEKKIFLCFTHDPPPPPPQGGACMALGLVVSEKKIFLCFSHCKSMGAIDPRGGAIFDPRGMIGRIYIEDHYILLHTKYEGSWPCGFGEDFFYVLPHHAPGAGPVWTPGARLAGFIKRTTIQCYTQNMKGLGLVVSEKKIFLFFPL